MSRKVPCKVRNGTTRMPCQVSREVPEKVSYKVPYQRVADLENALAGLASWLRKCAARCLASCLARSYKVLRKAKEKISCQVPSEVLDTVP